MAPRAVCLFKVNYLGDAIAFLPTVRGVRDAFPAASVVVVCSAATADLYLGTFRGLRVVTVPRESANGVRALAQLPRLWAKLGFRGRDVALLSNDEPALAVLGALFGAARRIGFDLTSSRLRWALSDVLPIGRGRNIVDLNFDLVRRLTGNDALMPKRTPVGFAPTDRAVVDEKLGALGLERSEPFVLIHPFGKKRYQMWGLENYRALEKAIGASGMKCVFISGGEREKVDNARVASGLKIAQLASLCARARLFVGSNSGPMHLAAAMGTPTLAVQGATAREWDIFWDDVPHNHIVATQIPCVPCERFGAVTMECTNHASPMACMKAISVEQVYAEVKAQLDSGRPG